MGPQISECIVCREAITNPICPECLANEARTWLAENASELAMLISKPWTVTEAFSHTASRCVICGNDMALCAHCYTRDVFQELAQHDTEIAAKFAQVFNYEFFSPHSTG